MDEDIVIILILAAASYALYFNKNENMNNENVKDMTIEEINEKKREERIELDKQVIENQNEIKTEQSRIITLLQLRHIGRV